MSDSQRTVRAFHPDVVVALEIRQTLSVSGLSDHAIGPVLDKLSIPHLEDSEKGWEHAHPVSPTHVEPYGIFFGGGSVGGGSVGKGSQGSRSIAQVTLADTGPYGTTFTSFTGPASPVASSSSGYGTATFAGTPSSSGPGGSFSVSNLTGGALAGFNTNPNISAYSTSSTTGSGGGDDAASVAMHNAVGQPTGGGPIGGGAPYVGNPLSHNNPTGTTLANQYGALAQPQQALSEAGTVNSIRNLVLYQSNRLLEATWFEMSDTYSATYYANRDPALAARYRAYISQDKSDQQDAKVKINQYMNKLQSIVNTTQSYDIQKSTLNYMGKIRSYVNLNVRDIVSNGTNVQYLGTWATQKARFPFGSVDPAWQVPPRKKQT
jgi:hypothetical protein